MNACKVLELMSNDNIKELKRLAESEIKEKGGNKELRRFRAAQKYVKNIKKTLDYKAKWSVGRGR